MRHHLVLRGACYGLAALLLNGCAYHRLSVATPDPADQYYHREQFSAFGWGAIEEQRIATKCPTNLLSEVRVRTSFGQGLANVLTFGALQLATVEYRCAKLPTAEGVIEP
jgi:hypothetical protein